MYGKEILLLLLIGFACLTVAQRGGSRGGNNRGNGNRGSGGGTRVTGGASGRQSDDNPRDGPTGPKCNTPGGQEGTCKHFSGCVFQFENLNDLEKSSCDLGEDVRGVCCPNVNPRATSAVPVGTSARRRPADVPIPSISDNDIDISGRKVLQEVETDIDKLEAELSRRGLVVRKGSAGAFHLAFFGDKKLAQDIGHDGQVLLETAEEVTRKFNLSSVQSRTGLGRFNVSSSVVGRRCPRQPRCPMTKYRSIDGSCNNVMRPMWGKSFIAFNRFIPSDYADGISKPRVASDGGKLPSARVISSTATPDEDVPNNLLALGIMQWAQFIDHDFSLAAVTRMRNGEGIRCCDQEILDDPRLRHPACFEIEIPRDDPFYARHNQRCMEFVRTMPAPSPTCTLGPKEVLNQLTSFIDGSQVYGSTEEEARRLRSLNGGLLRGTKYNNLELLPRESNRSEECVEQQTDLFCFMAGDERVNEQISLTAMHTIWFREHNRIARELSKHNPGWTDEIIYQEARRIVGAEIQHITYNEFLPILLGRDTMRNFRLLLRPYGFSDDYDPSVNPTIGTGFSSSAYRYGHTLVQGKVNIVEENGRVKESHDLSSQFFNPLLIYQGKFDGLIRGLATQPAQTFDRFVTKQLTNHLFQPPSAHFGLDLIALNIQRARDNGVPSYNTFREYCGFQKVRTFDEMKAFMHPSTVEGFKKNYRNVDDIDLFPAGVAEKSLPHATLGPTFACIAAEQFRRLKVGDRFFYENGGLESSFSRRQLNEIRKVSLARVYCDNSDDIKRMQPLALVQEKTWNPKVPCRGRTIPRVNLEAWKNEPTWSQ